MKKTAVCVALFLLTAGSCFAVDGVADDLSKIGMGARPMGMGRAFVSVADDVNSVFINPAGLGHSSGWQVISMYTSILQDDVRYIVLGGSNQFEFGQLGLGIISTGTGSIVQTSATGGDLFDYHDTVFILSWAKSEPYMIDNNNLYTGISLKYFQKKFSGSHANTSRGIGLDLGISLKMRNGTSIGATAQNILPTRIISDTGGSDIAPVMLKAGVSKKYFEEKLLLAFDADIPVGRSVPFSFHAGGEYSLNEYLSLRAGLDQNISAATSTVTGISAGVGLALQKVGFDYAYRSFQESGIDPAHFISISLRQ